MAATTDEDGQIIVTCDEPGCDQQFTLRPPEPGRHTGNLAGAVNAGWQASPDESAPDLCPQHHRL